jgi:hypothetical protein
VIASARAENLVLNLVIVGLPILEISYLCLLIKIAIVSLCEGRVCCATVGCWFVSGSGSTIWRSVFWVSAACGW